MYLGKQHRHTSIEMKLAKRMTRVYLVGVLSSLAHLNLVRTMKCGLYTQGQVQRFS